jgi:putative serine protease PepD
MTESFRRSGEYENPQGDGYQGAYPQQQHATSPVNPEWPPPPAHEPAEPVSVEPGTTVWPGGQTATAIAQLPAGQTATTTAPFPAGLGHGGDGGYDGGIPLPPTSAGGDGGFPPGGGGFPTDPHLPHRSRGRGPIGLLVAVALVAAAVGGGTAYGFQELTGKNTTVSSSATTDVVPSSKRGDVAAIAAAVSPSVVEINATIPGGSSTGSGVILTSNGEIVTNNHVIAGASSIKVVTDGGKQYTASVVGTDPSKDLAMIKLSGVSGLKPATLGNSAGLQVGDQVVAIGSPEGLAFTVTSGIVSALNRSVTVPVEENQQAQQGGGGGFGGGNGGGGGGGWWPFQFGGQQFNGNTGTSTTTYKAIQTDASLNPGNSGGALINASGDVVGINSAMYSSGGSSSSSDAGSVGLGFAIPINTVKSDLATLRAGGTGNNNG